MTEEPEAELQATADLSPVSPSPVHTASPMVVPALQDTVDTIDAMVAAVAATNAANTGDSDAVVQAGAQGTEAAQVAQGAQHAPTPDTAAHGDDGEFVDDDNDPYGDESTTEPTATQVPTENEQQDDGNDDYAKTFDSPINPGEGDGDEESHQQHVPTATQTPTSAPASEIPHDVPEPQSLAHKGDVAPSATQPAEDATATTVDFEHKQTEVGGSQSPVTGTASPEAKDESQVDIAQLVADLTSKNPESQSTPKPSASDVESLPSPNAFPAGASLPPRPPQPSDASQVYPSQHHPAGSNSTLPTAIAAVLPTPSQPPTYGAVGAPGPSTNVTSSLPLPLAAGLNEATAFQPLDASGHPSQSMGYTGNQRDDGYQAQWDQFVADERQYMSEAKWDRFPEGSRLFIGNLSSDKVSKRDVFDMFYRFGRLAQISLKSAYGFVQYHTVDEGHRAIENLEGIEIKGRRIHLEVSKLQDKSKKERARSPDRGRNSRDNGRRNDRYSGQRDDHRGGRNHSPRRNDYHHDGYGRDRNSHDFGRRGRERSRSPDYGRNNRDSYRRRSRSPHGRSYSEPELDLPRRYGADIPDVQFLLQADISRDFVAWVEKAFQNEGLRTHSMYLHPRLPKDQVVQRQAAEGVHAVVDLDMRAQNTGKIPVQAFDRSGGSSNIRFDQYVDLDPPMAAQVILRTKASSAPSYGHPQHYEGSVAGYGQGYPGLPQQQPHAPNYYSGSPPASYPPQQHQRQQSANQAELAAILGNVDPATLQQLVASLQGPQGTAPMSTNAMHGGTPQMSQPDLQSILSNLTGGVPQQSLQHGQYGAPYGGQPAPHIQGQQGGPESSAQVQNIMAHLARYRQ